MLRGPPTAHRSRPGRRRLHPFALRSQGACFTIARWCASNGAGSPVPECRPQATISSMSRSSKSVTPRVSINRIRTSRAPPAHVNTGSRPHPASATTPAPPPGGAGDPPQAADHRSRPGGSGWRAGRHGLIVEATGHEGDAVGVARQLEGGRGLKRWWSASSWPPMTCRAHPQRWARIETGSSRIIRPGARVAPTLSGRRGLKPLS